MNVYEKIDEIAIDDESGWLKKAKRRRRWRWILMPYKKLKLKWIMRNWDD